MPGPEPGPGPGVMVIGMHRSGTSAVTRVLNLMGLTLCQESDLMAADSGNPRGYWESTSLGHANEVLLRGLGARWSCPPTPPVDISPIRARQAEAAHVFHLTYRSPNWVWKDPRNSVLLPFWSEALEVRPVVVLVVRHPLEVAASLERRNRMSREWCLALWERYNYLALDHSAGRPAVVVAYEQLLANPKTWADATMEFLTRHGVDVHPPSPAELAGFIDPGLRRARVDSGARAEAGLDAALDLYATTVALAGAYDAFPAPAVQESAVTRDFFRTLRARGELSPREVLTTPVTPAD